MADGSGMQRLSVAYLEISWNLTSVWHCVALCGTLSPQRGRHISSKVLVSTLCNCRNGQSARTSDKKWRQQKKVTPQSFGGHKDPQSTWSHQLASGRANKEGCGPLIADLLGCKPIGFFIRSSHSKEYRLNTALFSWAKGHSTHEVLSLQPSSRCILGRHLRHSWYCLMTWCIWCRCRNKGHRTEWLLWEKVG